MCGEKENEETSKGGAPDEKVEENEGGKSPLFLQ